MNIFSWIVFGLITGVIVSVFDSKSTDKGVVSSMILGIVGAIFGGLVGNLILRGSLSAFDPFQLLIAMGSALFVLLAGRTLRRA